MADSMALLRAVKQLSGIDDEDMRSVVKALSADPAVVTVTQTTVQADEDWIEAIEKGLGFVGKALEEERRFIRVNGEVLPIEKIKKVSKESIMHLARHSDYVNIERSEDEIVPDKMYSVERLNDYATYENRFLYTLLCTAKDFVAHKYAKIAESKEYGAEYGTERAVSLGGRRLYVNIHISDSRVGDANAELLKRVEKLMQSINFYLRMPIMVEVSKANKVQSDLTLTNVLRMDKNFAEAVALYDFLMSYKKQGFSERKKAEKLTNENLTGMLATAAYLQAYLVEMYGKKWGGVDSFELFERAEREDREELARLKKRTEDGGIKYVNALEKRNLELETQLSRLKTSNEKFAGLDDKISRLQAETDARNDKISELNERIGSLIAAAEQSEAAHADETERLKKQIQDLTNESTLLNARITALMSKQGESKSYSSEAEYNELESEYEALGDLLQREWQGVKQTLRKEMYSDVRKQIFGAKAKKRGKANE